MINLNDIRTLRDLAKALELTPDEFLDRAMPTSLSVSQDVQEKIRTYNSPLLKGFKEYYVKGRTIEIGIQLVREFPPEFYEEDGE